MRRIRVEASQREMSWFCKHTVLHSGCVPCQTKFSGFNHPDKIMKLEQNLINVIFEEEGLRVNWQLNQDSSMVGCQARYLEVRVQVLVQVQIFLLKFDKECCIHNSA